ncbi:histone-fold-containing protein [Gorgonomyces haynaldii]|nr:histone-fold-containing protein [Gorgonomyces haynaldii]
MQNSRKETDEREKEQDRYLPIANVSRIMKRGLPQNAKIAKEAKDCVQDCVSEFIAFVTSEASDRCAQEKRKTINGEDILWALNSLGFEHYTAVLRMYLENYRQSIKSTNPKEYDMLQIQNMVQQHQQLQLQNMLQQDPQLFQD